MSPDSPPQDHAQRCAAVQVLIEKCDTLLALSPEPDTADAGSTQARIIVFILQDYLAQAQTLLEDLEAQLRRD
jgi:hypothetical protein